MLLIAACLAAVYATSDETYRAFTLYVLYPSLFFGVMIVWIIINFKLAKVARCKMFTVYGALLIAQISLSVIVGLFYGSLIMQDSEFLTYFRKYSKLANALFQLVTSGVSLIAWLSMENFAAAQIQKPNENSAAD